MARARFIRPEFFTDEKLGELPFGARLLFAGIWCHSDLRGVFEHSARQLRVHVFPFDEGVTSAQVSEWLAIIDGAGLVIRFEADGKAWGHVANWSRHQSVTSREVEIWTKRPAPPEWIEPTMWGGYITAAIKAGRIKVDPRTVPEPFQNFTLTSPSPSPPTPTPACESAHAPVDDLGERRRAALEAMGAKTRHKGEDLMVEWAAVTKGLKLAAVEQIFRDARPGILWPKQFTDHRLAKAHY